MLRVAVVAGGYTDESVISLKSCELIYSSLNPEKYDRTRVRILKEGWFAEIDGEKYPINKGDFSFEKNGEKITFDVVFNTIHGTPGEDGYLQAYFEMIGLPYNGCPFYQSALTFNQVGLPCFVKPNRSGSSLGISKVHKEDEFEAAMQKAFLEDKEVLIESFLDGTEISVGVLNYKGETMVLGITEIVSHTEFFDYDAKYNGLSDEITPARLTPEVEARVREIAAKAYKCINMSGFSRSEYIIVNGEPHFIEMNTLPGFSPASIFPQQAAHAGIALEDLMDSEIEFALNRPSAWIE